MLEDKLKSLWKDLFNDNNDYINWYFENIYIESKTNIELDEDKLVGMLYKNSYHVGDEVKSFVGSYIVGVGVTPENQGEGIMKKMMLRVFDEAKKLNQEFIYLTPIDKKIYERFGFTHISTLEKYKIDFELLSNLKKTYKVIKFEKNKIDDTTITKLRDFYEDISKNFYIKVLRDKKYYKQALSELFCEDGLLYVSYDLKNEINGYIFLNKDRDIIIKEFLFKDKDVLSSLLSVVYSYKNYYEKVTIITPEGTYLEDYLETEVGLIKEVKNKVQVRIIDIYHALERISTKLKENDELRIHIQDRYINRNDGIFLVKNKIVEKIEGDNIEFDISLDINSLATFIYGFRDYSFLKKINGLYIKNKDKESLLSNIFTRRINYFNQDF